MMKKNNQVLLGMSGGTDSSVSAMLLQEAGYQVTGVTFRFYEKNNNIQYLDDARELADRLNINHKVYDARSVFRENVVNYFIDEYMNARTPVPCVICNSTLKWPLLRQIADENGIFHISTGHYVRVGNINGKYCIQSGIDKDKDQSFFLWGLSQEILSRMLLPMGEMLKSEARQYAAEKGFTRVATKKDSIGVCFCPFDYHSFLRDNVDEERFRQGRFIDEEGNFLGLHEGYPFYTVGQRRGLGIHLNRAVFVRDINPDSNEIVLAPLNSLEKAEMYLKDWNIIDESILLSPDTGVTVKIRYRKQENHCTVSKTSDGLLHVALHEPLTSIAPGQAAAFYKGDLLLGGGIIVCSA